MDKKFNHKIKEKEIYDKWLNEGYFKATIDPDKESYTIVLPPPNASGKMHTGNALMVAIEDLLIRQKRMQGYSALWLPGTDHAGFETQTTFERLLKKQKKSRFDFDRKTLYSNIMDFVMENKGLIEKQLKDMGASVDWDRYSFTLDDKSIDIVTNTFKKLEEDEMIYRDDYIVNYSFKWGTTFSDAEIVYKESQTPLYTIKYKVLDAQNDEPEHIEIATIRPETIFVDTHLAINPKDEAKKFLLERKVENPLTGLEMAVIEDPFVDMEFGSGIVKLTPAHDKTDFEVGRKHGLDVVNLITLEGRLNEKAGDLEGETVLKARKAVVEKFEKEGKLAKVDEAYENVMPVDYRTGDYVEQLVIPNWFVKVDKMKKMAYDVLEDGDLKIYPKWQEVTYRRWVENMHDWAISRQVVWGIQIPAWYDVDENPDIRVKFLNPDNEVENLKISEALEKYTLEQVDAGLQSLIAPIDAKYTVSQKRPGERFIQETDTFDTWFSSGQWPLITLGYPDSEDFKYFYPTAVMETGWDLITRWVSRMVMFGLYLTGESPFKDVSLHGLVRAVDGKKMSKSIGNVINPEEYLEQYGADVLRMGLISGTANGKDFNFPQDKIVAYRNFSNKIWNMAKFLLIMMDKVEEEVPFYTSELDDKLQDKDKEILEKLDNTIKKVNENLEKYRFADAADAIYHFMWDDLASDYIEHVKDREDKPIALSVLRYAFLTSLKLLHPFMPFITEEIWTNMPKEETTPLIVTKWPE